jgi:hypothetical protein
MLEGFEGVCILCMAGDVTERRAASTSEAKARGVRAVSVELALPVKIVRAGSRRDG